MNIFLIIISWDYVQYFSVRCFQSELDEVVSVWNSHRVRPYRNQLTPPGRPNVLYSQSGNINLTPVSTQEADACMDACNIVGCNNVDVDRDVMGLVLIIILNTQHCLNLGVA